MTDAEEDAILEELIKEIGKAIRHLGTLQDEVSSLAKRRAFYGTERETRREAA